MCEGVVYGDDVAIGKAGCHERFGNPAKVSRGLHLTLRGL